MGIRDRTTIKDTKRLGLSVPVSDSTLNPQHSALVRAVVAAILLVALALRLVGVGWGVPRLDAATLAGSPERTSHHLDEDNFLWGLTQMHPAAGDFDIRDYHWGSLQFYLIDGVLVAAEGVGLIPAPWEAAFVRGDPAVLPHLFLLGRLVSVAAGVAATAVAIGLGRALSGRAARWPWLPGCGAARRASGRRARLRHAALVTALVVGAAGWGGALLAIYTAPDPRLAATAWFRQTVPPGATVLIEDKNDLVPVPGPLPPPGPIT